MKVCATTALALILILATGGTALPPQGSAPLSEREITYLLQKKVSSSALIEMIESYGVAFATDEGAFQRLKKAGASASLMNVIRKQAKARELRIEVIRPEPPPPPDPVPAPAREHLQQGQQKLKNSDFIGALHEFAEAEKIFPKWDQVFKSRGLVYEAQARYLEAAEQWKQYMDLAPADSNKVSIQKKISEWEGEAARAKEARSLLAQGEQQLKSGDAKGATETFQRAATLDNSVGPLLGLARAQLLNGDFASLAVTAQQVQKLDSHSALAAFYLADAELRQGRSASQAVGQGMSSNPYLAYGRALLAREFRFQARQAGKLKLSSADNANAAAAEERNRRGWVLWNGGYFQAAVNEIQWATQANPADESLQCDLAYTRLAQRDTSGASAAAREALRVNSESVCGHHALALSFEKAGEAEKAAQEFQAVEKLASDLSLASLLHTGSAPSGAERTN